MDYIICINAGSSSVKYSLFQGETELLFCHFEHTTNVCQVTCTNRRTTQTSTIAISESEYSQSLQYLASYISEQGIDVSQIRGSAVRVVHGGDAFQHATRITSVTLPTLEKLNHLAPLHNPAQVALIREWLTLYPELPCIAVFDTAFHASIPEAYQTYALPQFIREQGIRKYGFHGISLQNVVRTLQQKGSLPHKSIICHLGSGCSITAVEDGQSLDTSMGYTPLGGVVMMTRPGDLDPSIMTTLSSLPDFENILQHESGLKAISGSSDFREILRKDAEGDKDAQLALQVFQHSLIERIGGYVATMQGCDAIIFTGAIGEGSEYLREQLCTKLHYLGIKFDKEKNRSHMLDVKITRDSSPVAVWKIHTRENEEMRKQAEGLM